MALEDVFAEAVRIDHLMSTYRDASEILAINRRAAKSAVTAGEELFQLIQRSLRFSELNDGAFDITYDSVGQQQSTTSVRFLKDGVRINLGGIAKGYVVERGVAILRHHIIQPSAGRPASGVHSATVIGPDA